jgi:WD40 repeat protein/serine/threonine protein kinase/tetratricopeptide (TPR) repeat protein
VDACPDPAELSGFALGLLPESELERIARHIERCTKCEAAVQALDSLTDPVLAAVRHCPSGSSLLSSLSKAGGATGKGQSLGAPLPQQLGDYRIVREIGRGGMGVVYEAEQVSLGRRVALKILPRQALLDPESVARFRRESRAAARLHHTNIVQVFGIGEQDGLHYFVMQYISGVGLDALIRELQRSASGPQGQDAEAGHDVSRAAAQGFVSGRFASGPNGGASGGSLQSAGSPGSIRPLSDSSDNLITSLPNKEGASSSSSRHGRSYWVSVARLGMQVAEALAHAHGQGILHRDVKPSNLLLDLQGRVWVTDFGLAKETAGRDDLTGSGNLIGTLRYVPPERFEGKSDARGDVYGVGLALYEVIALRPAFTATSRNELLEQVMHAEPARLRKLNPRTPYDLETIILKAIARQPSDRYQTAAALAEDLRRFVEDRPLRARRATLAERILRWCRRDPVTAGLIGALMLVFVAGFVGVFTQWRRAEGKAEDEIRARENVERAEEVARTNLELSRDSLYLSALAQSQLEWRLNDLNSAHRILELCDPVRRNWEWRYLRGTQHSELHTFTNPTQGMITAAVFSPDGRLLAYTGFDPYRDGKERFSLPIEVWDIKTGRHLHSLPGSNGSVSASFSPDSSLLAVCTIWDNAVQIWDVQAGKHLRSWPVESPPAFHPNGRELVSGGKSNVTFWDVRTGKTIRQLPALGGRLTLSPDGTLFAESNNKAVTVRETATGRELNRFAHGALALDHFVEGPQVAFSPDGAYLLEATNPPRIWETRTGALLHELSGYPGLVMGVAFSPDGRLAATAGSQGVIHIWDVPSGVERFYFRGHREWAACVNFHPDGWCLVSGGRQPADVKLWDLTKRPESQSFFADYTQAMAFDAAGRKVTVVTVTGQIQPHDCLTTVRTCLGRVDMTQEWATPALLAAFSTDGQTIVSAGIELGSLKVSEASTGHERLSLSNPSSRILHVAVDRCGGRVAASKSLRGQSAMREICVWDGTDGNLLSRIPARFGPSTHVHGAVALSPDGSLLAHDDYLNRNPIEGSSVANTRIRLRRAADGTELLDLPADTLLVWCLAFSPDGKYLAAGGQGDFYIWELDGGRLLHRIKFETGWYRTAFSPDSRRLACVDREQVKVLDVPTGKEILALNGAPPRPGDGGFNPVVAWSPDGRWLAASNWDGSVSLWEGSEPADSRETAPLEQVPQDRIYRWRVLQAEAAANNSEALFHLERLRAAEPPDVDSLSRRARLEYRRGNWDRAANDYRQAFVAFEEDVESTWLFYARVLLKRGEREEYQKLCARALVHFDKFKDRYPTETLGRILALGPKADCDPEVLARFQKRFDVSRPPGGGRLFTLGLIDYRAGRFEQAVKQLEECARLDPQYGGITYPALALAHHGLGHAREAERWYQKAFDQHQEFGKSLAGDPTGTSQNPSWPDFEILFAEATKALEKKTH